MPVRTQWNDGWSFWLDKSCGETLPTEPEWERVSVPHDWQIWHVENLYEDGIGWYKKTFSYTPGKKWALYFEGVYMDAAVYLNGKAVYEWKYGYTSFRVPLSDGLRDGENELLVRCCLRHPNSRWYSGAGIYRDVWLEESPEDGYIVPDSLYVAPREAENGQWTVHAQVEAVAKSGDVLEYALLDGEGSEVAVTREPATGVELQVEHPRLWDLDDPYCYCMRARLLRDGAAIDELSSVCGFRTVELSPDKGLLLNHRRVVVHGVALHHDLGCLGGAFSYSAAERQIKIMKDMGANAIRTAHNPPAPGVMALADKYGLLVDNEAFDCWKKGKNAYDYARFFPEWYAADVAAWVRRDRNHPSLLFWSIGNEVYDTHLDPKGGETMRAVLEEVKRHDPMGNGRTTFGSNYMAWEGTQRCAGVLDAVGYNYGEALYDAHHREHPDWVIYGSETASIVQSRGIYHFPLSQPLLVDDDLQCSSLGNSRTSWGAESAEACLASDERFPYSLGQFVWCGFDYIGEPTPYHTKNCYFGQVDTAGFPKDSFYVYQAGWHDWRDRPVLHILPFWDFNPGQLIDVCVISNLPEVELLVNGKSRGRKSLKGGSQVRAAWQVPYARGQIEAVGYDGSGNIVARDVERSFGDAAALHIELDPYTPESGGLVFCAVTARDGDGAEVKNANNYVEIKVSGPLQLLGLDNGDSTDTDEYKGTVRQLFSGKLLAVLAWRGHGAGTVEVSSPGLESARLALDGGDGGGKPRLPEITPSVPVDVLPVRKIELHASRTVLTPEEPVAELTAEIYPPEAGFRDLEWRATDARGITVPYVKLEVVEGCPQRVRATGLGDGAARIRCTSRNGKEFPKIISTLELQTEGMGSMYMNPYGYLSAALYTKSHGGIGNGNERGIATSRTEMSWVAYEGVDFGRDGADTLTISVFEMSGAPTPIRFWKGEPYAPGSKMIGERIYDKPTTWNVYKDETFQLDEPLTGTDVFGIELQCKVHIKGFRFTPRSRAWDVLPARKADMIYGDSYALAEDSVNEIGNNVSLVFRGLDFGGKGLHSLTVRGRTELENNTIHLLFEGGGKALRRVVEFKRQPEWGVQTFDLEPVYGKQDVTFMFLPGSRFDFMDFQFQ